MNWYYEITWWEYGIISLFVVFYILYIIRTTRKARQMGTYTSGLAAKAVLRTLYFSLLTIGLLGPTFGSLRKEVKAIGRDIYLVVDLSKSMDATDISPSRLERVKYDLMRWLPGFSSDRIGLIIFSNEAFVQCPLTYDQNALRLFIETLHTDLVPQSSTDLSVALRLALERHMDRRNTSTKNQAKIIVLISDGEDFGDEAEQIARRIEEEGLKLFTLGVGTTTGGTIPTGNGVKHTQNGTSIITRLESAKLQQLVQRANGKYFELSKRRNDVSKLAAEVAKVEGKLQDSRKIDISANKFYYFLIGALILLVVDILIAVTTIHL